MIRKWSKVWLSAGVALAALAALAISIPASRAQSGDEGPEEKAMRPPQWVDLIDTEGGTMDFSRRPIPGSTFGPDFESFAGTVKLTGRDFGAKGPFDFGNGDVALTRRGPRRLPAVGESVRFPVQFAAVSWRSTEPVEVRSAAGTELFDLEVTLSKMAAQPRGVMTLTRETRYGGTLSLSVDAVLRYRFTQPGGAEVIVDAGTPGTSRGRVTFSAVEVPWSVRCEGRTLRLPHLSGGICLGEAAGGSAPSWRFATPSIEFTAEAAASLASQTAAAVAPGASVDAGATLGRGVRVETGAAVRPGTGLGRGVVVGQGVKVLDGALVGLDSRLMPYATIGPNSYLGERVRVGSRARLDRDVVIHNGAVIGSRAYLGAGVNVGAGTVIGERAVVAPGVTIGPGSNIGAGAKIQTAVPGGTVVQPGTVVVVTYVTCIYPGGSTTTTTDVNCTRTGGAIFGIVPPPPNDLSSDSSLSAGLSFMALGIQVQQGQPGQPGTGGLGGDVDSSGVAPGNGGRKYDAKNYDCDDFASDLEKYLEGKGWNATFTCYWEANEEYAWYNALWTSKFKSGHCLTDIHLENGSYIWIEAQWTSGQGAVGVNLDANGDGQVGVSTGPGSSLTEGNKRIEVYGSAAEATAAGVKLD